MSDSNSVKLSFIIPAFNEEKYIASCLASIFKMQNPPPFEVIVADNNSIDQTADVIRSKFPQVKIVLQIQKGTSRTRNAGARIARGEYLAFIDADCRVPADWWARVEKEFARSPEIVMVNGPYRYFEVDSWFQHLSFYVANVIMVKLADFVGRRLFHIGAPAFGGDMVVKKTAFDRVGGFEEKLYFYGDDVELGRRIMRVGRVRFSADTWVFSSDRRFRGEGQLRTWWVYTINGLWMMIFGRPYHTKIQQDIR